MASPYGATFGVGVDKTHAIWPEHGDPVRGGPLRHRPLQRLALRARSPGSPRPR